MDNLVDNILNFIFPKRCLNCKSIGDYICEDCLQRLPYIDVQICPHCTKAAVGGFTHPKCFKKTGAERSIAVFKFEGLIREAVSQFKYHNVKDIAELLSRLIADYLGECGIEIGPLSIIIPVPLHPVKFLERGYNQSDLLAQKLGKRLGVEVWSDFIVKIRDNSSQTRLKLKERSKNVRHAYRIDRKDPRHKIFKGRDVVLLDDVFTSGATLRECAKVVKRAGARFVYLLTLAKG